MTNQFKQKYLKYKHKNLLFKQAGGMTLFPILFQFDKDRFEGWYRMKSENEHKNAFQILLDIFDFGHIEELPLNVLVGATCMADYDYVRFKNSEYYSLYIDNVDTPKTPSLQYDMYTIDYDTLGNFERFPTNIISQIHFDTGVAYFAPIDYLTFAERTLQIGGKIIWDLVQHGGTIIFRSGGKFRKSTTENYTEEQITQMCEQSRIFIDTTTRTIIPIAGFFDANSIAPQISISVVEFNGKELEHYKTRPYDGYIDYCTNRFRRLTFKQKYYTFANYTYPVPIRTYVDGMTTKINVHNKLVEFVVNDVMHVDERDSYIKLKKISIEKIIQLCDRINISPDLQAQITTQQIIKSDILNVFKENLSVMLPDYVWGVFTTPMEYIEGTKIY